MEQLLDIGLKDGVFAGLFVWVLHYVFTTSKEREDKLTSFLDSMRQDFSNLVGSYEKLSDDVNDIRNDLSDRNKE